MSAKMKATCVKVSTVLVFLLFFQFSQAQTEFAEAGNKMEAARKELGTAVLAIYKDGKIVYQKNLGDCNIKTQAPVAALSKWLTAALVMTFVEQGKISLDDKVSKYLPIFSKYAKGYITIRDCISHFSGIESNGVSMSNFEPTKKFISLDEEVEYFASKKDIQANPAVEFRYSNIGMNIAARVLEVITKRGFEQLMGDRITRPMMMRSTNFSSMGAVNPSGGALSSATDYLNFLSMIMNKGMFNGKRILSEQSIAEMETIRTTPALIKYAPKQAEGYSYGFGEWITATDEKGNASVVACPGLYGSWAMIDKCRGYAFVVITKELVTIDKRIIYTGIKDAIDSQVPCK